MSWIWHLGHVVGARWCQGGFHTLPPSSTSTLLHPAPCTTSPLHSPLTTHPPCTQLCDKGLHALMSQAPIERPGKKEPKTGKQEHGSSSLRFLPRQAEDNKIIGNATILVLPVQCLKSVLNLKYDTYKQWAN